MEQFLGFAIPGIPYGCTYALVAVALVLTYQATGSSTSRSAAQAYVLSSLHGADPERTPARRGPAFVLVVVVGSPLLGLGVRPAPLQPDPELQQHGQAGHAASASSSAFPALMQVFFAQNYYATPPSIRSSTPTPCTSPSPGAPFNGTGPIDAIVVHGRWCLLAMGDHDALHASRAADARGGREPATGAARRGQRQRRGRGGLGRSRASWPVLRASCSRPIFGQRSARDHSSRSWWRRSPPPPGRCFRSMPIAARSPCSSAS